MRIHADGIVACEVPVMLNTHCQLNVKYYPADVQKCGIEITSGTYSQQEIQLLSGPESVSISMFSISGEWGILKTGHEHSVVQHCCPHKSVSEINFYLVIKRRTNFYILNILVPVMALSMLSSFVFKLPASAGEKVSYALTVLLSYSVFLTMISDQMPTTSHNQCRLGMYYCSSHFCIIYYPLLHRTRDGIAIGFTCMCVYMYVHSFNSKTIDPVYFKKNHSLYWCLRPP